MPYPKPGSDVDPMRVGRGRKLRFFAVTGFCLIAAAAGFLIFIQEHGAPELLLLYVGSRQKSVNPIDGLTYVSIPAGSFHMGCWPKDAECEGDEEPTNRVTIAKAFRLGESEVTQAAYEKVMGKNPSHFAGGVNGLNRPVEQVTWNDAKAYCQAIGGRLPTDAEWEYSARAGTTGARYGKVESVAWYDANSGGSTHPVKQKSPNAWGLYDMLGNVSEWAEDSYPGTDGQARTVRGSCFTLGAQLIRSSLRGGLDPAFHDDTIGFRCAW